jgi:hypothetical protein
MDVDLRRGPVPVGAPTLLQDSWREEAAARALDRAHAAVTAALRRLAAAEDVEWVGGPAAGYRYELEDVTDRTRAAQARLVSAVRTTELHAAAVQRQGVLTLGEAPPWPHSPGAPAFADNDTFPGPRRP